jgi:hypothetical protein
MPSIEEIEYYVQFSAASYSLYKEDANWTCPACVLTGPDVTLEEIVINEFANILVLFNVNKAKKEIIVTYRGSLNLQNVLVDALLVPIPVKIQGAPANIKVSAGFELQALTLLPQTKSIVSRLVAENPGFRLVFTGHSLGSTMTLINGLKLRGMPEFAGTDFAFITYGQPRIGNKAFVDFVNAQPMPLVRVSNRRDLFTHMPVRSLQPYFIHTQNELWLQPDGSVKECSHTVYEDPECSNSLGPVYNPIDHMTGYFDTSFLQNLIDNLCPFLSQVIINFPGLTGIDICKDSL